jgi:hypothetical protein
MSIIAALRQANSQVEAVKEYFRITIPSIDAHSKAIMDKNYIGFLLYQYPAILELDEEHADIKEKFMNVFTKLIEIVKQERTEKGLAVTFRVKDQMDINQAQQVIGFLESAEEYVKARDMMHMHLCNVHMLIMVKFEQFIADIFRFLIERYPDKYLAGRQMKYSDIVEKNIDSIKKELIQKEIDAMMYKPFGDWFAEIKSYNTNIGLDDDTLCDFKEAYFRRNIIVHNNCIVNTQYLSGVNGTRHECAAIDSVLKTDKIYIEHIFEVVQITMYAITISLLKILSQEEIKKALSQLFDMGFRHLQRGEWNISEYVFRNLKSQRETDAQMRAKSLVNYWISIIHVDGYDAVNDEIAKCDFSAHSEIFIFAKMILLRDYDKATIVLKKIFNDVITPAELDTWPLFIDYRKSLQYEMFRKEYEADFSVHKFIQPQPEQDEMTQENNSITKDVS